MPIPDSGSIVAGILMACAGGALLWRPRRAALRRAPAPEKLNRAASPIRQRLAEEEERLERLDAERARRGDSSFGRIAEERIVWRELLELELQDLDERVRRIRATAERAA